MTDWAEDFAEAPPRGPQRVYLDDRDDTIFAVVDWDDYAWAVQWVWSWVFDKRGRKRYARRNTRVGGRQVSLWLHKEITRRAHGAPPSDAHEIADHIDGDSLRCQRENLRWATRSENNSNRAFARCTRGRFT